MIKMKMKKKNNRAIFNRYLAAAAGLFEGDGHI